MSQLVETDSFGSVSHYMLTALFGSVSHLVLTDLFSSVSHLVLTDYLDLYLISFWLTYFVLC